MTSSNTDSDTPRRKILARNILKYLTFGFKLYEQGTCDAPIKNDFKLADDREIYGINKQEAANILGISVRQFDRDIKAGKIPKGRKFRNKTNLFWDENEIRHLSTSAKM